MRGDAGRIEVEENGARYFAEPTSGQKTGWYYDQRDNRAFIAKLASGKTVLDAYCYTGGFAIAAGRAGAKSVTGIDSSAPALALAEDAAKANDVEARFVKADVLTELERISGNERYGIVIADPPPFVKSRKDLEAGARAYRKARQAHRAANGQSRAFCCSPRAHAQYPARTASCWNAPRVSHARDGALRWSIRRVRAPITRCIRCCRKRPI